MKQPPRRRAGNRARITRAQRDHAKRLFTDEVLPLFGNNQRLIAQTLRVSESTVTKMKRRVPAEQVIALETACKLRAVVIGQLSPMPPNRHRIRPDIYPLDGGYDNNLPIVGPGAIQATR